MSLPLTVIGGFLGAGKTTLLNHWLRHAGGQRLAVLVNDFGALNIDASLIESTSGDTIALTNGCVCCQIGDDLSMALMQVLDAADAYDAVVIEASGVSDPWRVAQMGRADPGLRLDGVIVVVDASAALAHAADPLLADTLARQLQSADLVVLNKCESAQDLPRVREWLGSQIGGAPRFETSQGIVPIPMLSGIAMPHVEQLCSGCSAGHDHEHEHEHEHDHRVDHGTIFDTWSCRPARRFDADTLRAWLRAAPLGLLRLKGILRTGESGWSEIQFAGRRGTLRAAAQPPEGAAVVAISLCGRLPRNALDATFSDAPEVSSEVAQREKPSTPSSILP